MTIHRPLRTASFAALMTALGCTATIDDDRVDELAADALSGACTNLTMTIVPLRDEMRFGVSSEPNDRAALNPRIPAERICDRIIEARDKLKGAGKADALAAADKCVATCDNAEKVVQASPVRGSKNPDAAQLKAMGEVADAFNAALGNDTNFSDVAAQDDGNDTGDNAGDDTGDADNGDQLVCTDRVFTVVQQGRENRFGLDGKAVALNPAIPVDQVCNDIANRVQNQGLDPECNVRCGEAKAAAVDSGVKGFQDVDPVKLAAMLKLVDQLNAILGKATDFSGAAAAEEDDDAAAEAGVDEANEDVDVDDGDEADAGDADADVGDDVADVVCPNDDVQVIVKGREHRFGRKGSQVALNPAIPMEQICNELSKDVACRDRCVAAREVAIASGVKGFTGDFDAAKVREMGELADQFNAAMGHSTNFADNPIIQ